MQVTGGGGNSEFNFNDFVYQADTVVITQSLANKLNLNKGSTLTVYLDNQAKALNIIGIIDDDNFSEPLVLMDIGNAQNLLSLQGRLSHIDLQINDPSLIPNIEKLIPSQYSLIKIESFIEGQAALINALSFNLSALSYLAMAIGGFLIFNTVRFSILQRLPSFARLRVIGLPQQSLNQSILVEAIFLGLLGSFIGLLLGAALSLVLAPITQRTISDVYALSLGEGLVPHWSLYLKAALAGLGITFLAAYLSLLSIDQSRLVKGIDRIYQESQHQIKHRRNALSTLTLALLAWLLLTWGTDNLLISYAAVLLLAVAALFLLPSLLTMIYWLLSHVFRRILKPSSMLFMALRDCEREKSRVMLSIIALSLAVASTNGIAIMINSFKFSVDSWLDQQLAADVYIRSAIADEAKAELPSELLEALQQRSDIDYLTSTRFSRVLYQNRWLPLEAVTADNDKEIPLDLIEGSFAGFKDGSLLISEPFSRKQKMGIGDSLTLSTPSSNQSFTITGIVRDYGSEHGRFYLHRETYNRFWLDNRITSVGIHLKANNDKSELIDLINNDWRERFDIGFIDSALLRQTVITVFNQTFASTHFLRILVIVIAIVAIISTLLIYQLQRSRQLFTLRAMGLSQKQLDQLFCWQAVLIGTLAGLFAIPMGLLIAWCLVEIINPAAFGWTLIFQFSPTILLSGWLIAIIAGALSAIYPCIHYRKYQRIMDLQYE